MISINMLVTSALLCTVFATALAKDVCDSYEPGQLTNFESLIGDSEQVGQLEDSLFSGVNIANGEAVKIVQFLQNMRGDNPFLQAYEGNKSVLTFMDDAKSALANSTLDVEGLEALLNSTADGIFSYVRSLLFWSAPGFGLFVLALICCPCFFCARCCCSRRCCKAKKQLDDYTFLQKMRPLGCYLFFSLVCVFLALLAITNLSSAMDSFVGIICEVEDFAEQIISFVEGFGTLFSGLADDAGQLATSVASSTADVSKLGVAAQTLLAIATSAEANFTQISTDFSTVGVSVTSLDNFLADLTSWKTGSGSQVTSVLAEVDSNSGAINDSVTEVNKIASEFDDMIHDLVDNLTTDVQDEITSSTDGVKGVLSSLLSQVSLYALLFYSTVFFSVAVGIFALLTYLTPCSCDDRIALRLVTLSWAFTYVFMLAVFLVFAIYFPVSIIFSDVCGVVKVFPTNFYNSYAYFGGDLSKEPEQISSGDQNITLDPWGILQGCFGSPSVPVMKTLNLSLATFADGINVSESLNKTSLESMVDLSALEEIVVSMKGVSNETSFQAINQSVVDGALEKLNSFVSTNGNSLSYTQLQCTETSSCSRSCLIDAVSTTCAPAAETPAASASELASFRLDALNAVRSLEIKNHTIAIISQVSADVSGQITNVGNLLSELLLDIDEIQNVVNNLTSSAETIDSAGECSFVAKTYASIIALVCDNVLASILMVTMCNCLIGIFSVPIITSSIGVNVRLFGVGSSSKSSATVFTE